MPPYPTLQPVRQSPPWWPPVAPPAAAWVEGRTPAAGCNPQSSEAWWRSHSSGLHCLQHRWMEPWLWKLHEYLLGLDSNMKPFDKQTKITLPVLEVFGKFAVTHHIRNNNTRPTVARRIQPLVAQRHTKMAAKCLQLPTCLYSCMCCPKTLITRNACPLQINISCLNCDFCLLWLQR